MLQLLFGVIAIYKIFHAIIKVSRFIVGIICSIAIVSLSFIKWISCYYTIVNVSIYNQQSAQKNVNLINDLIKIS